MADFMIRFFVCNLFISAIIGILLAVKYILQNHLTPRMQYNLWFPLLGLLAMPFIPISSICSLFVFSWFENFKNISAIPTRTAIKDAASLNPAVTFNWMNDISISVSQKSPSVIGLFLCILWGIGIFIMVLLIIKSFFRLNALKKSALPLQNPAIHDLYCNCLMEMHLTREIPIYSTAFLKSPIITGLFKPCIYLPIHLISDNHANDIRYMLLHELQHYKYKDALANYAMAAAGILYWFNPVVWYALKEMKNDREIACDTSVLKLLNEGSYEDYGNTLINFAEKLSRNPFPFATGISGNMKQMKKRIINIAAYQPASFRKKVHSTLTCLMVGLSLLGFAPVLSIQAGNLDQYYFNEKDKTITYVDLSTAFGENKGSFVLYDETGDSWQIYNKASAATRTAPASTFKIYSALFNLESGRITPENSWLPWNGQEYSYELWNTDQTLASAMQNSVTWYFQTLDQQADLAAIRDYVRKIGYGNQTATGDAASYWFNSSLKISPIEQVEMLKKFYYNQFGFAPENMEAVKDSICLSSTDKGTLYGKTGTVETNGQNTSGWFIGYIEKEGHTYFFATNIQNESLASGPVATELTFSILSDLKIWDA